MQVGTSISRGHMAYDVCMATQYLEAPSKHLKRSTRVRSRASETIDQANQDPDAPVQWPPAIRGALRILTYKQRRFAVGVAAGLPKVEAYRQAYDVAEDRNVDSLMPEACAVLRNPIVSTAIDLLVDWNSREWLFDDKEAVEVHLLRLDEASQHAEKASDRIAASVAILKAKGAFVSRSEVRHIHTLDADSTKGIVAELANLLGTPESKPPKLIESASVASVEFTDPDSTDS